MNLEQFKQSIIDFAEEVGIDVKNILDWKENLIDDSSTTSTNAWSSQKISSELSDKVDKVSGKGLSTNDYTTAEKDKLAGLESSRFKGEFPSLSALETAITSPEAGDYADVDEGVGEDVVRYLWDSNDDKWVKQLGQSTQLTGSQIKQMYESQPDTNAFTDNEKSKLDGIEAGAEVNTITGVKGSEESTYRTGNVNIAMEHIEAGATSPLTTYTSARDA